MNAFDVIEAYVADVAVKLPRRQRNDVAFELRSLLREALQDRAEVAGRQPDAEMATELAQSFGDPEAVAARYRPTLTIIDPADGMRFMKWMIVGLAIIWAAGLVQLQQSVASGSEFFGALGQWWGGTVVGSLWWPGLLVVSFAAASWSRRRSPQAASTWKPLAQDRIHGSRAALVLGLVGIVCGVFVLLEPRWLLDVVFDGRAAPAAYEALTYTDTFRGRQAPWLLVLLLLNIPILLTVIVQGRWSSTIRRIETGLGLLTYAVMAWTILDGPVLKAPSSDGVAKLCMVLIIVYALVDLAIRRYRRVKPAPDSRLAAIERG